MSAIKSLFFLLSSFCIFVCKVIAVVFVPFFVFLVFFFIVGTFKGKRLKRRTEKLDLHYSKRLNVLKRFYVDMPRRIIQDLFERDPDAFGSFGVHIFAGEQGSGKTIAALHFVKCLKEQYPKSKLASNIDIKGQDGILGDWRDVLGFNNGKLGQIIFLDEIQNWFSSNESRNFPPEMLTEITQQRKQRKIVVGTSQVFTRISKPIREQITLLYLPFTIMGCITFVRCYRLKLNDDGTIKEKTLRKFYFFVHDDELRNSYDTFQKVQRMSLTGFKPRTEKDEE